MECILHPFPLVKRHSGDGEKIIIKKLGKKLKYVYFTRFPLH
jgi:hypothetical protein